MFLISNCTCSRLAYRGAIDFVYQPSVPQTCYHHVLALFCCCCSLLPQIFYIHNSVISKCRQFYFFLPFYTFFFPLLSYCVRIFSAILIRRDEKGHPCHVPKVNRKALSLSNKAAAVSDKK